MSTHKYEASPYELGIGIIGAGYISSAHAIAFSAVAPVMESVAKVNLAAACSNIPQELETFSKRFGFQNSYLEWQDLINDDNVNAVIIGTPPFLHYEQAKSTLQAGKHLLCEKPIAMNASQCEELYKIAHEKGLVTAIGLTYLANPGMFLARELIQEGALGEIYSFSGHFNEDHLADPNSPFHWHCNEDIAGYGATNDLGYHIVGKLVTLFGLPSRVVACRQTKVKQRKNKEGEMQNVTSDDMASAVIEYKNGLSGIIQVSRVATGRDQFIQLEINGSKGSLLLDMENMNDCNVFLRDEDKRLEGFRKIKVGPHHKHYSRFCPAAGHGMGFNDFLVIQAGHFASAIAEGRSRSGSGSGSGELQPIADMKLGCQVQSVVDAMVESSDNEKWVDIADIVELS